MTMADIEEQNWPLTGIRIVTIMKVDEFCVDHHTGDTPYYQIWINGFVLDSMGDVASATLHLNVEDNEPEKVDSIREHYGKGSLHWLECEHFNFDRSNFVLYLPETRPVAADQYEAVNHFFLSNLLSSEDDDGVFSFAKAVTNISDLRNENDGSLLRICCEVIGIKEVLTKRGDVMCFATAADVTGIVEVTIFSGLYGEISELVKMSAKLLITGKVEHGEMDTKILAEHIIQDE